MKMHRTPAVYQLHNFSISFFYPVPQEDSVSVKLDNSASGYSVVAHDNKVDQAMALVQKHVMVAIKEEVHILQKHVRELTARNLLLEHENSLLRTLTNGSQSQHEMDNNTQKQMFNTQIHRNATNSPNP